MDHENDEQGKPREPDGAQDGPTASLSASEFQAMRTVFQAMQLISRKLQEVEAYGAMGKPHPDALYVEKNPGSLVGPNGRPMGGGKAAVTLQGLKVPMGVVGPVAQAYRTLSGSDLATMFGHNPRQSTEDGTVEH